MDVEVELARAVGPSFLGLAAAKLGPFEALQHLECPIDGDLQNTSNFILTSLDCSRMQWTRQER